MAATSAPANTTVIVTGAARGMGLAMTLALTRAGVRVAAADLASSSGELRALCDTVASEGHQGLVHPIECDITRWTDCAQAVKSAVAHFGAVHGLVNNAGIAVTDEELATGRVRYRPFYETEAESWRRVVETNVVGTFQMAKAISPTLVAQGWGRIVNVTTSHTTMVAKGFSPYGPTKAAIEAASAIWAKDLADTGVTVNVLVPGGAGNTRMVPLAEVTDRSSLVQPEVMMAPIAWLMSAASDGVTGRRFIARTWDPKLDPKAAAEASSAPAGW